VSKKRWVVSPSRGKGAKVPDQLKQEMEQKANELIESVLKPQHVQPPPEDAKFNYIVDIYTKWYRHYFYFCSLYRVPGAPDPDASFEEKFARLEHVGEGQFNLSYMRHTGQWFELARGISLEQVLDRIASGGNFYP